MHCHCPQQWQSQAASRAGRGMLSSWLQSLPPPGSLRTGCAGDGARHTELPHVNLKSFLFLELLAFIYFKELSV